MRLSGPARTEVTARNTGSGHDGHPIPNLVVSELQAEVLPVARTRAELRGNNSSTPLPCPDKLTAIL